MELHRISISALPTFTAVCLFLALNQRPVPFLFVLSKGCDTGDRQGRCESISKTFGMGRWDESPFAAGVVQTKPSSIYCHRQDINVALVALTPFVMIFDSI